MKMTTLQQSHYNMSIEKLSASAIVLLKKLIETQSFSKEEDPTAILIEGWFVETKLSSRYC